MKFKDVKRVIESNLNLISCVVIITEEGIYWFRGTKHRPISHSQQNDIRYLLDCKQERIKAIAYQDVSDNNGLYERSKNNA